MRSHNQGKSTVFLFLIQFLNYINWIVGVFVFCDISKIIVLHEATRKHCASLKIKKLSKMPELKKEFAVFQEKSKKVVFTLP